MREATETASTCLEFETAGECQKYLTSRTEQWLPKPW